MRTLILAAFMYAFILSTGQAQVRLIGEKFEAYFDWFHQQAQVTNQFTDGATLRIFSTHTQVHADPSREATVLGHFVIGQSVRNHVTEPIFFQQDEINGYGDLWYRVSGCEESGKQLLGYVWGGDIARAWREVVLDESQKRYTVLLGVSGDARQNYADIKAELRTLSNGQLMHRQNVPGLCVFEECGSSTLLRVVENCPVVGKFILEASTLTAGCLSGVEKALFFWNGQDWQRFYYAEYTTAAEYANTPFKLSVGNRMELCRYSHEDANYNPVLVCKTVPIQAAAKKKIGKAKVKPRA